MQWKSVSLCALLALPACHDSSGSGSQPQFDASSASATVTNVHYPLVPGTTHRILERADPQSAVVKRSVSHFPSTVAGIPATVVLSRRFQQGETTEERFEYFVQDDQENVWTLGADVTQFAAGERIGHEGSWRYGVAGATAGLVVPGRIEQGQSFRRRNEEGARRRARIAAVNVAVTLPELGRFEGCLQLLESGGNADAMIRHLAPQTGPILLEDASGGTERELIEIEDDRQPDIRPALFVDGVDHPLFPLPVGRTWLYAGDTDDGYTEIEIVVLDELTEIMTIDCTTVRVREYVDGELTEESFDWFAQDTSGNVWYFGEDVTGWDDDGEIDKTGSWMAGVDGGQPGYEMLAVPRVGDSYRQEYSPGIAEDVAIITSLEAVIETGLGTFTNCLEVFEENPLEPDSLNEFKYYALEIGLLLEVNADGSEYVPLIEIR